MIFQATGKLVIDPVVMTKKQEKQSSWKKTAYINLKCDIDEYYRWLLNTRFNLRLNPPIRGAHVTIINDKFADDKVWAEFREAFNGKPVTFEYDPSLIRTDSQFWWLIVQSPEAQALRDVLGLGKPYYGYHLTVGQASKDVPWILQHNDYIHRQILKYSL